LRHHKLASVLAYRAGHGSAIFSVLAS